MWDSPAGPVAVPLGPTSTCCRRLCQQALSVPRFARSCGSSSCAWLEHQAEVTSGAAASSRVKVTLLSSGCLLPESLHGPRSDLVVAQRCWRCSRRRAPPRGPACSRRHNQPLCPGAWLSLLPFLRSTDAESMGINYTSYTKNPLDLASDTDTSFLPREQN